MASTISRPAAVRRSGAHASPRRRLVGLLASGLLVALLGALLVRGGGAIGGARPAGTLGGPLPACRIDNVATPHAALVDWDRTLLDTSFALDRSYVPGDLTPTAEAGLPGGSVRALVVLDLEALARAARRAGETIGVESAYRSFDAQARTFDSLEKAYGADYAVRSAARPGHSEHQLGTTVDFVGGEAWLAGHAWRYGFVMSYPPGSSPALTCYKAETWHFRYFGRERAAVIEAAGISSREWLWLHADDAR